MSSSQSGRPGKAPESVDVDVTLSVYARPPDVGNPPTIPTFAWREGKPDELIKKLQLTKAKSLETRHNFAARSDPFFSYSIKRTDWENEEEHFNAMRIFLNDTMSVNKRRLFEQNTANVNKEVLRHFLVEKTEMYEGRLAFQLTSNSQTDLLNQLWSIGKSRDPLLKAAKEEYRTLRREISSTPTQEDAPKTGDEAQRTGINISDLNARFVDAKKRLHWLGCLSLTISGSKILVLPFEVPKEDLKEWTRFIRAFMSKKFELDVLPNPGDNSAPAKSPFKFQEIINDYDHLFLCSIFILGPVEEKILAEVLAERHFKKKAGMKVVGKMRPGIVPKRYQEKTTLGDPEYIRFDFNCTTKGETTPTPKVNSYKSPPSNLRIVSLYSHCSFCKTMSHTRFHCKVAVCKRCRVNHQGKSCKDFKGVKTVFRT